MKTTLTGQISLFVTVFLNLFKLLSNCGQVAVSSSEIPNRSLNLRLQRAAGGPRSTVSNYIVDCPWLFEKPVCSLVIVMNQGRQIDTWLYSTNKALITVSNRIK